MITGDEVPDILGVLKIFEKATGVTI